MMVYATTSKPIDPDSPDSVFVATDTDLEIIGAAHLAREDGHAQLGISVLPRSRGQGIGGALLERCAARARNWGMRVMFMNCLVENAAMMHLARKQGLKIRHYRRQRRKSVHCICGRSE